MTAHSVPNYNFKEVESRWQKRWDAEKLYQASSDFSKPKYYVLEMFPYPSGRIHMGHLRNYTIGDVIARFKLSSGYNVLHPMGWDAFGLPAENAAIERSIHPAKWTYQNIQEMSEQLKLIGFTYDWEREIATCSPDYYKHEQKIFLEFLEHGLAYQKEAMVNWDPVDHTVLANEQVIDGKGWRSGAPVERKKLRQWFLKITQFADELLAGLQTLDAWPEKVRLMQEKWIGKSTGLNIYFKIKQLHKTLDVYTTRPDTIFGASFCAISPYHPLATEIAAHNPSLQQFIKECDQLGVAEEIIEKTEKKGIDTGLTVLHPFDSTIELPLYVANFVLMEYGTGAIFACPAHDQRDLDFARKYNLPVKVVVSAEGNPQDTVGQEAYTGSGVMVNSDFLNGHTIDEAKLLVCQKIEDTKQGLRSTHYRLRDWGVSRQRYWGCPIPIIYCDDCGTVPVPEKDLPVLLPDDPDLSIPGNPLERHPSFKHTTCPSCHKPALRETDTFDTFFESSWYFARFCSPQSPDGIDLKACAYWLPVDQYIGGVEHAVLHLLYARFFTYALHHCKKINLKEPFKGLMTQGMVCHETYQNSQGQWVQPDEVIKQDSAYVHFKTQEPITVGRSQKMSKSKKNTVDPLSIIDTYGADTARLFMLSDSPPERDLEWSDAGIEGAWRYINRVWRLVMTNLPTIKNIAYNSLPETVDEPLLTTRKLTHKTIAAVTDDIESYRLNRAIARIRELSNHLNDFALDPNNTLNLQVYREALEAMIHLISPMAPHLAQECWQQLGHQSQLVTVKWPVAISALLVDDMITIAVQLNGKLKGTIDIAKDLSKEEIEKKALACPSLQNALQGKEIRKIIVVPNRIVNVVA